MGHRARRGDRDAVGDEGETLVEVLASVLLMGIAVLAILGGLFTVLVVTDTNRRSSQMDTTLQDLAERVRNRSGTYAYRPCTTAGGTVTYPALTGLRPDWTATMTVRYSDGSASRGTPDDPNHQPSAYYTPARGNTTFASLPTCPTLGTVRDYGVQAITIRVTSDDPGGPRDPQVDTITVYKRDTRCPYDLTDLTC